MIRFFFLLVLSLSAFADTQPPITATIDPSWVWKHGTTSYGTTGDLSGVRGQFPGICAGVMSGVGRSGPYGGTPVPMTGYNGYCTAGTGGSKAQEYVRMVPVCSSGSLTGTSSETYKCSGAKTCPSGYDLSPDGLSCNKPDCKPGQYWDAATASCKCDNGAQTGTDGSCCPVAGSGGGAPFQWCQVGSPSATSCDSPGQNGCNVRCKGVTFQKGVGDQVSVFPKMALGSNCAYTGTKTAPNTDGGPLTNTELNEIDKATKNPEKAKTPEGCLASGQGYVQTSSGTTCVSGGETGVTEKKTADKKTEGPNGTTETTKETTNEQGPNGTGTTTTTTTTKNPDGSTTTTTTKTTKNPDGTITEEKETKTLNPDGSPKAPPSKESSTNDPGEFCQENPNSPLCKGQTDTCKDNPGRISCGEWGDIPEGPDLGTLELGEKAGISPVGLSKAASCPAGIALPKGIGYYNWEPACQFAEAMAPIVIGIAWLAAFLIVIGVKTE